MTDTYLPITMSMFGSILAGGLIGLERSYHARPAGFRTHTLVCLASTLLMLVDVYQSNWLRSVPLDTIRTDPTRMAQGIMTGIGFLGAGVIFKEGVTVRGLTTAASIWITASIGILIGIGFYYPAVLATILTLGILSLFRWIESKLPSQSYAHFHISFDRQSAMLDEQIRQLMTDYGFSTSNFNYRLSDDGKVLEYKMIIRTSDATNISRLIDALKNMETIKAFRLSSTGD
jgi:putative Mg2+ transporter-C (MgtC) family protein